MSSLLKKNGKNEKKKRKWHGSHGIITVFVTLIMVPVVAINGILVDAARIKLYSSQAVMAADAYGDAVLSEFDNLLKDLYGLFSVTQNEAGLSALKTYADYAGYAFNPNGDGSGKFSGFMPYKNADVDISYTKVEGASLSNNNVLMTQISDFMKYRVIGEFAEGFGLLDALSSMDHMDADMDAMDERTEITKNSTKALEKINEYYKILKSINGYPSYMQARKNAITAYGNKLTEVARSADYKKYVNYLQHKTEIDAARAKQERIRKAEEEARRKQEEAEKNKDKDGGSSTPAAPSPPAETMTEEELRLVEQYVDVESYKGLLRATFRNCKDEAERLDSDPIDFDNAGSLIDALARKAGELDGVLSTLQQQVANLKAKLPGCSEEVKKGLQEEIDTLEQLTEIADDFKDTCERINAHDNKGANSSNKTAVRNATTQLNDARGNLIDGNLEPLSSADQGYWPHSVDLRWYNFQDDKKQFYDDLTRLCGNGSSGDKNAGDEDIESAENAQKDAEREAGLDQDEQTSARDIPSGIASQLQSSGSSGDVPSWGSYFSKGLSFDTLSQAGSHILDKFLVTTYDFGMFSSRVSGIAPEADMDSGSNTEEEYADYSLTKIKMSKDVNYLYGAELEYILGGHNSSKSNLNNTRNIICGIRMTLNFASSYSIKEVNDAIKAIADIAAAAATVAAPVVRIAVSGALRLAFAGIEMAADWTSLKKRENVVFFKQELDDLESKDRIASLLKGRVNAGSGKSDSFSLSYEDYLYVLICLFINDNTLLSRTSNLITLNVNQAQNSGDTLSSLKFKMSDTVTAVKSTCKIKADFVIVPENIAKLFYDADTNAQIEALEDNYYGYSVIRGY